MLSGSSSFFSPTSSGSSGISSISSNEEKGTIANGRQHLVGIDYVIVNGALTVKEGKHTGKLNGVILKHHKNS